MSIDKDNPMRNDNHLKYSNVAIGYDRWPS